MGRKKLDKFRDNDQRDNVIQRGKPIFEIVKGRWGEKVFGNQNSIVAELGCGRGEYTIGFARLFPEKNFLGVDIKGSRIWTGSGIAVDEGLANVAFLRTPILNLEDFFVPGEISEIWITFPDPRPRERDIKRRLTHYRFLEMYKKLLRKGGTIHLKTDNTQLFNYTLDLLSERKDIDNLEETRDLYNSHLNKFHYGIKTRYESKFLNKGEKIKYLKFSFLN